MTAELKYTGLESTSYLEVIAVITYSIFWLCFVAGIDIVVQRAPQRHHVLSEYEHVAARSILRATQNRKIDAGRADSMGTQALMPVVLTYLNFIFLLWSLLVAVANPRLAIALGSANKVPVAGLISEVLRSAGVVHVGRVAIPALIIGLRWLAAMNGMVTLHTTYKIVLSSPIVTLPSP